MARVELVDDPPRLGSRRLREAIDPMPTRTGMDDIRRDGIGTHAIADLQGPRRADRRLGSKRLRVGVAVSRSSNDPDLQPPSTDAPGLAVDSRQRLDRSGLDRREDGLRGLARASRVRLRAPGLDDIGGGSGTSDGEERQERDRSGDRSPCRSLRHRAATRSIGPAGRSPASSLSDPPARPLTLARSLEVRHALIPFRGASEGGSPRTF